ncbi:MAG: hypothetical protein EOO01_21710 [Chitinophagaceae bacterium]|nr:MAG: hypothetical protein EOO01_21710 [Chitinophagaceae bacterium]
MLLNSLINVDCDDPRVISFIRVDAENFEFGVVGGLTFQTEIGLFATGRYNYGFTEIFKSEGVKDIHNSVFQIGVGYKF